MEQLPVLGKLLEFTVELETRPLFRLTTDVLYDLQQLSQDVVGMHDPVFCLDESTGTMSVVFQVEAIAAPMSAMRGAYLFVELLHAAGVSLISTNVLERISAYVFTEDPESLDDIDDGDLYLQEVR